MQKEPKVMTREQVYAAAYQIVPFDRFTFTDVKPVAEPYAVDLKFKFAGPGTDGFFEVIFNPDLNGGVSVTMEEPLSRRFVPPFALISNDLLFERQVDGGVETLFQEGILGAAKEVVKINIARELKNDDTIIVTVTIGGWSSLGYSHIKELQGFLEQDLRFHFPPEPI